MPGKILNKATTIPSFSNKLLFGALISLSSVLAEERSLRIEDLEEIPRDLWPDLT